MKKEPYKIYEIVKERENFHILKISGRYFRSYDEDMYISGIEEISKEDAIDDLKYEYKEEDKLKPLTKEEEEEIREIAREGLEFISKYLNCK